VGGARGTHGEGQESVQGFGGKARRKESLGRPKRRWEYGIRMDLMKVGWGVYNLFSYLRTGGGLMQTW
jgi:hypothetical protein